MMVSTELPKKLEIETLIMTVYLPSAFSNSPVLPSKLRVSLLLASDHVPTNDGVVDPKYNLATPPCSNKLRLTAFSPPSGPEVV